MHVDKWRTLVMRVWLFVLAFHLVGASFLKKSSKSKSKSTREESPGVLGGAEPKAADVDFVDEALKSVSADLGDKAFVEDHSWYINPSGSLSLGSGSTDSSALSTSTLPNLKPCLPVQIVVGLPPPQPPPSTPLSRPNCPVTPPFILAPMPCLASSTVPTPPPLPNLFQLDCNVDIPVIQAWLLYKYRIVSGNPFATQIDFRHVRIQNWPFGVLLAQGPWNYVCILRLKQELVHKIQFEYTENTMNPGFNFNVELALRNAFGMSIYEPINWMQIEPYFLGFLTTLDPVQWNEQDRQHILMTIQAFNRRRVNSV